MTSRALKYCSQASFLPRKTNNFELYFFLLTNQRISNLFFCFLWLLAISLCRLYFWFTSSCCFCFRQWNLDLGYWFFSKHIVLDFFFFFYLILLFKNFLLCILRTLFSIFGFCSSCFGLYSAFYFTYPVFCIPHYEDIILYFLILFCIFFFGVSTCFFYSAFWGHYSPFFWFCSAFFLVLSGFYSAFWCYYSAFFGFSSAFLWVSCFFLFRIMRMSFCIFGFSSEFFLSHPIFLYFCIFRI